MEKKVKLGFVGSRVRMDLIRQIIPAAFPEIAVEIYENDQYDYCPEMERDLYALKKRIDGVIFGGELQFKLYQSVFEPDIPLHLHSKGQRVPAELVPGPLLEKGRHQPRQRGQLFSGHGAEGFV